MRNLLRAPLTWLVLVEIAVVASLAALAWNAVAHAVAAPAAAPASSSFAVAPDAPSSALPDLPDVTKPSAGPMPGLNVDSGFWQARLSQLNQEQVYFEQLEWRVVHSGLLAAERYIEGVVVPSLKRAETAKRWGASPSPPPS